jgi:hypothetical protein
MQSYHVERVLAAHRLSALSSSIQVDRQQPSGSGARRPCSRRCSAQRFGSRKKSRTATHCRQAGRYASKQTRRPDEQSHAMRAQRQDLPDAAAGVHSS